MAYTRAGLVLALFDIDALKFGQFTLKSGIESPVYFDLRVIISYPKILQFVADEMWRATCGLRNCIKHVCGVPYTALPIATCISTKYDMPMIIKRKETKTYGTKKLIEGSYNAGDICLLIEDVVTTGSSVIETARDLGKNGIIVQDVVVLLDRCQGGRENLEANGIQLHSIFTLGQIVEVLFKARKIDEAMVVRVTQFINENSNIAIPTTPTNSNLLTYYQRAFMTTNPVAQSLFTIMESKKTNLCISADLTSTASVLELIEQVGPFVCLVKTHIDILEDFSSDFILKLQELATKHKFIVFEDRKFADIGNTVKHQYQGGMYHISEWADIVNAHSIPGEGVVQGLKEVGLPKGLACLMIAQMSSAGNLASDNYTASTVKMAEANMDFVIGFISTSRVSGNSALIHMTPGVQLEPGSDTLGQQYLTPDEVIKNRGSDVIIVGRGIYQAENPEAAAKSYQEAGYKAYQERLIMDQ